MERDVLMLLTTQSIFNSFGFEVRDEYLKSWPNKIKLFAWLETMLEITEIICFVVHLAKQPLF